MMTARSDAFLVGKTAIVTGSGRGIGRAIAIELAQRGAQVAVNFFRRRESAEETAAVITAAGGRAIVVKANVGQLDGLQTLVQETVKAFGGVDIFIANAASGVLRPAVEQDERTWDWTMNINARSLLFGARAVAPFMQAQGWGRIIGITSIGSTRVLPEYAMVGISKAAVNRPRRRPRPSRPRADAPWWSRPMWANSTACRPWCRKRSRLLAGWTSSSPMLPAVCCGRPWSRTSAPGIGR